MNPEYKKIHDTLKNMSPSDLYSNLDLSFLPKYDQKTYYKLKAILFVILSLLPKHKDLTDTVFAQLAVEVKTQLIEEDRESTKMTLEIRDAQKENLDLLLKKYDFLHELRRNEVFHQSTLWIYGEHYLDNNTSGNCHLLATTYLYLLARYGEEEGYIKFKEIIHSLLTIDSLPYTEKLEYHIGIASMNDDIQNGDGLYKSIPLSAFPNRLFYRRNLTGSLHQVEALSLFFNPNFAPNTKYFYLREKRHTLLVIRELITDPSTNEVKTTITVFDANHGIIKSDSVDVIMEYFESKDFKTKDLEITEAKPFEVERYVTHFGTRMIDFLENRILGNEDMKQKPLFKTSALMDDIANLSDINEKRGALRTIIPMYFSLSKQLQEIQDLAKANAIEFPPIIVNGEAITPESLANLGKAIEDDQTQDTIITIELAEEVIYAIRKALLDIDKDKIDIENHPLSISKTMLLGTLDRFIQIVDKLNNSIHDSSSSVHNIAVVSSSNSKVVSKSSKKTLLATNIALEESYYVFSGTEDNSLSNIMLFSEEELRNAGVYNTDESIVIQNMMKEMMETLITMLEFSGLDPNEHIAPELITATLLSKDVSELEPLIKDNIVVENIKTKEQTILSIKGSKLQTIAHKFHNKILVLQNKADALFKGYATFSSTMTLAQARDNFEIGKIFHQLSDVDKTKYIAGMVDSSLDVVANTIGAANKVTKEVLKGINILSKASKTTSAISGIVGVVASGTTFMADMVEYCNNPNEINEINLAFSGVDYLFSGITVAYPLSALVTLPMLIILQIVKASLITQEQQKIRSSLIIELIELLESYGKEAGEYSKITFENGVAVIRNPKGDIVKLSIEEQGKLTVSYSKNTGYGIKTAHSNQWSKGDIFGDNTLTTEHSRSLDESIVFADRECLKSGIVKEEEVCSGEGVKEGISEQLKNLGEPLKSKVLSEGKKMNLQLRRGLTKQEYNHHISSQFSRKNIFENIINNRCSFLEASNIKQYSVEGSNKGVSLADIKAGNVETIEETIPYNILEDKERGKEPVKICEEHLLKSFLSNDETLGREVVKQKTFDLCQHLSKEEIERLFENHGIEEPIQGVLLPEQFQKIREEESLMLHYQTEQVSEELHTLYKNKETAHRVSQYSSFDAIRLSHLEYVQSGDKRAPIGRVGSFLTELSAAKLGDQCFVVNRPSTTIDFSTVQHPPLIILPNRESLFTSKESLNSRLQQEIGCSIHKDVSLPLHNTYDIIEGVHEPMPILLLGSNKDSITF